MHLSSYDSFLWAAALFGHLLLLIVLWRSGKARSFPVFTVLIAAYVVRTVVLYWIHRDLRESVYFNTYWALAVVDVLLQLLVVYELASQVFKPVGEWALDIRNTFVGLLGSSVLAAMILTWLAAPVTARSIQGVVIRGSFFSSVLMSELFVGMMVLSATAGLPWKTHVARLAQGLGIYSIASMLMSAAESYFGVNPQTNTYTVISHARISVYLLCVGYWIVTLWQDAPAPRELPESLRTNIFRLNRQVEYDLIKIRSWRKN